MCIRDRGKAVVRVEGHARALLRILGARGLSVSDAERGEILCCAELTVLDAWIERAPVSYKHLRAHETVLELVCRLLLEKTQHRKSVAITTDYIL